jgi:glutathione synthase
MSKKIAFQMDPMESVNIDADSSFHLAMEAQARGHEIYYHTPDRLAFENGKVTAKGQKMRLRREHGNHVDLGPLEHLDLHAFDVVWLRQDPPFDMGYITTTHVLDLLKSDTLVVNDPFWVRNYPEKLLMLQFPELIPPTTIARDLDTLKAFRAQQGDVIVKPLYGNGGAGVFRLTPDDRNIASLHELFTGINSEPLIIQKFLPDLGLAVHGAGRDKSMPKHSVFGGSMVCRKLCENVMLCGSLESTVDDFKRSECRKR